MHNNGKSYNAIWHAYQNSREGNIRKYEIASINWPGNDREGRIEDGGKFKSVNKSGLA